MSWITELFCRHQWIEKYRENYNWSKTEAVNGTEYWLHPKWESKPYSETIVLNKTITFDKN